MSPEATLWQIGGDMARLSHAHSPAEVSTIGAVHDSCAERLAVAWAARVLG